MHEVKIGTRGSKLALWQANYIAGELEKNGLKPSIVVIDTKGDRILDVSIAKIGSKGVFTEELEEQLRQGKIDIAVHSAKDLQSVLPGEFQIIALTKREKVNDVLVSHKKGISLQDSLVVGTSSTRRIATLKYYFPLITTVEMRGNLQTRFKKMENGACDALILAYAGISRMGYDDRIVEELPLDLFTPAVGQGCLAIEACKEMDEMLKARIREAVNDPETERMVTAERAYLRLLEGGCSIPAFALAQATGENKMNIKAGIFSLDGNMLVKEEWEGSDADPETHGASIARAVLDNGGREILSQIRKDIK